MVALSPANLLGNYIDIVQARALATILKKHSALKSLCGNRGDETKLDVSGKLGGAAGAIMLAPEIIDNGAMTKIDIISNALCAAGGKALAQPLDCTLHPVRCVLHLREYIPDVVCILCIRDAPPGMGMGPPAW
jgi:hypothetical protein